MGNSESQPPKYLVGSFGAQGKRPTMEDATTILDPFGTHPEQAFFGIFDGHNGARCAQFIASELPKNIEKLEKFKDHPELALFDAFTLTNNQWFREEPNRQDGSCAVTVLIRNDHIYVANAGDSRAIVSQADEIIPLSRDHKPTDTEEAARVANLGGKIIGGRVDAVLAVSRAFGDLDYRKQITCEPDIKLWSIVPDTEFVVMGCDGVWDVISNEDVGDFVRTQLFEGTHPETVAENLVNLCLEKHSLDNVSVIIVSFLTKERRKEIIDRRKTFEAGPEPISFTIDPNKPPKPPLRAKDPNPDVPYKRQPKKRNTTSIQPNSYP